MIVSHEQICEFLGVDKLLYQEIEDLKEAVTRRGDHHIERPCMACLDGWYVTGDIDEKRISKLACQRLADK
jgi:amidophosphoribosyltransferase